LVDRGNEDLAIAGLAGLGGFLDGLDGPVSETTYERD
jgi:hypothetical protein